MSFSSMIFLLLVVVNTGQTFGQRFNESETLYKNFSGAAGEEPQAIALLKDILRNAADKDEELYARWRLACWEFRCGDPSQAREMLEKALQGAGEDRFLTFAIQRDLGEFYTEAFRLKLAEDHIDKALELAKRRLSMKGETIPIGSPILTFLQIRKTEFEAFRSQDLAAAHEAFSSFRMKIETEIERDREERRPPSADWTILAAKCDTILADLERRLSKPFSAIERLTKCLDYLKPYRKHEAVEISFGCHISLAINYYLLTRFPDAHDQLAAAAQLLPRIDNGRNAGDLENAQAVVRIEESSFRFENDPHDPVILKLLEEAEKHAGTALDLYGRASKGEDNPIAYATLALGQVQELRAEVLEAGGASRESLRDQYERAKTNTAEAIRRLRTTLPASDDLVLQVRRRLAGLSLKLDQVPAAKKEAEEAFALFLKGHPQEDQDFVGRGLFHYLLLEIEDGDGNVKEAARHAGLHRHLAAQRVVDYLAGLTAPEQLKFFRQVDDPGFHASLRLGIRHDSLQGTSAEWMLNGKAKIAEVMAYVNQHERSDKNSQKFQQAVQRQAYLLYGPPSADLENRLLEAEAEKRNLAADRALPVPKLWYELAELRRHLSAQEVYVDVFRLPNEANSTRTYYAWVITASDPVQVVQLGDADKIDERVRTLVNRLEHFDQEGSPEFEDGFAEGEKQLKQECLKPLSDLILAPLRKVAAGKKNWIVSPDGPLWNLPWAALLLPGEKKYAVEEINFRYVISGRDLFNRAAPDKELGPPLVFADPDYNLVLPGVSGSPRTGMVAEHLPQSLAEGQEVAACLKQFFKSDPRLLVEKAATKEALLKLNRPPRMVYLSTHGFFFLPAKVRVDDPLLCCGIVFAGFNFLPDGKGVNGEALPGLLTGAEVLSADLQGTELVVLSACQSGTGVTAYGQSAASLRHAFHLAGARAVVASLWTVEDQATKNLMVSFMKSLSSDAKTDKADALRRAQLEMIANLKQGPDHHAHPFFWAAFTLSGF